MPHYNETRVTFASDRITIPARTMGNPDGSAEEIMMSWESPIMEASAEWVCSGGGDILEIGFGMGISASFIQQQSISSHTIVESHPDILERALEWARDKPNVSVIFGEWFRVKDGLGKYDGIFYDTYADDHMMELPSILPNLSNPGCKVTWWNNNPGPNSIYEIEGTEYVEMIVNPDLNSYFNHDRYYLPKKIY